MEKGLTLDMKGRYFQELIGNGNVKIVEIHICEYDKKNLDYLMEIDCLEESVLGGFLELIQLPIPDSTRFLYKLQKYTSLVGAENLWEFNDNISGFEQYGFYDINDLLLFCKSNWGINKEDFTTISNTCIP